ncbi:MAG: tyrosine-type recombinase/integrase [Fimbriimonadales bacterium]|nr:MAG: tyrosine recombinase XerD [Fimbriimonadales bacterium]
MRKTQALLEFWHRSEIAEARALWLESVALKTPSPRTVDNYERTTRPFLVFLQEREKTRFDEVQPHDIRAYLLQLKQAGRAPHTLVKHHTILRTFWNWCMREGLTEHNPFAKVEKPKAPQKVKPALTPEEIEQILQACEGTHWLRLRDKALILLLLDTGMRIHEAHSMAVGDAKQNCLLIRGKGAKQRMVFLSPEVRLALARYLKACPFPLQESSPLWHGRYGALTLDGLLQVVDRIGRRAGLPKHLGAHAFRRTFATWSLRNGIDLEHLRQLMGHSDYTVLRQYLALVENDLKQAHAQHSPLRNLRKR